MTTPKKVTILACDGIHPRGVEMLRAAGFEVRESGPLKEPELRTALADVDGVLVRSSTKLTRQALEAAPQLKLIGRAGAGVDTIDLDAATAQGIVVMNAPDGNTLAAAEQAIALLFAMARHTPAADAAMRAGEWPKGSLTGFELEGKKLGVIGFGRIGSTVARKARGLGMEVAAHDSFLPQEAAARLDVRLCSLDELLPWAEIVTLHMPLTDASRHILDKQRLLSLQPGARVINAARGGLIDERALLELLDSGHLAGAALDVFEQEPLPADSPLRRHPRLVIAPHLGASTSEAQVAVSTILARQVIDFFERGALSGSVNLPPLDAEMAREVGPLVPLAAALGRVAARLVPAPSRLEISYLGRFEGLDRRPLTRTIVAALLESATSRVTAVNALAIAAQRGIDLQEHLGGAAQGFDRMIKLTIESERGRRELAGTLHRGPRVVQLDGVDIEFDPAAHLLLLCNEDRPGMIGLIGTQLGVAGVNIISFSLGATGRGKALAAIAIDRPLDERLLRALRSLPGVISLDRI